MRKFSLFFLYIFVAFSLVSCMNIAEDSCEAKKAYIRIAIAENNSRTIDFAPSLSDFDSFYLSGVQDDDETKTFSKTYSDYSYLSNALEIETGTWTFTLTAKKRDSLVYKGTVSATIAEGDIKTLTFALEYDKEQSSGFGSLSVTFNYHNSYTAEVAKAGLYSLEDDSPVYEESSFGSPYYNSSVTYSQSYITAGSYRLKVNFYSDTSATMKIATWSGIVNIAPNLTTSTTIDISFNGTYSITYNLNGGSLLAGETAVKQCSHYANKITLPHLKERTGFAFDGWATSSDGEKVYDDGEEITISDNTTLYAKWSSVDIGIEDLSSLDLSTITAPYTLTVTGTLSTSNFRTIASIIKSANNDVTLDLSKVTGLTSISGNSSSSSSSSSSSIFAECYKLKSVVFPDTLEIIGSYAFYNTSLTSVSFPSSVKTIGDYAFYSCNLKSLELDGVETIGNDAFSSCSSLESLTIKNVSSIGSFAFSSTHITSVEIDATEIGSYAFYNCSYLTSVTTSDKVTKIRSYAFSCCPNLTTVTIGSNVTNIGDSAFESCSNLTSVTFSDTSTWYYYAPYTDKTTINVSSPSTNASNLKQTSDYSYMGYYAWYKE